MSGLLPSAELVPPTTAHRGINTVGSPCMGKGVTGPPRPGVREVHLGWTRPQVLDRVQQEVPLQSAAANMGSALLHTEVVTDYLRKELLLGHMLGPFLPGFSTPELHINRFGVVPKGHNTGRWRLITDLSFPPERSVNDGVDAVLCSLVYTTVDRGCSSLLLGLHYSGPRGRSGGLPGDWGSPSQSRH